MKMGLADSASVDLHEGVPGIPKLRCRELKAFGPIEVAYHRFLPGEIETLPFKGPVINLHLSAPHRLVQHQDGRKSEGLVATNDVAITPAGMPGYWRTDAASEDMSILLDDRFVRRAAAEAGAYQEGLEVVPLFSAREPQIERVGRLLLSEMRTGGLGGELFAESLANLLALHLLRHHSSLGRVSGQKSERGTGISERAISQAVDYINDNLPRKLTLAGMAGAARMSPYHFARSFKAATGLPPHRYVVRRRVERAKELLLGTDLAIAEVAKAVGFANQSHLTFRVGRLLGASLKALRREAGR
jgi:AraC family transcriptional regulator